MFPFSLLGGLFGGLSFKIIAILALVAGILGTGTALYFSVKHSGEIAQQLIDQRKEYERVIGEQTKTIEDQKAILDLNETSSTDLSTELDGLKTKFQELNDFLNSEEARQGDREASDFLKSIIEKLSKTNGDK